MQPIDALTDMDKKTIQNYIYTIGQVESAPLSQILNVWNTNKRTLFRAFGNKLSISKDIIIEKNEANIARELNAIYHPYVIWWKEDQRSAESFATVFDWCGDEFIASITSYWANKDYTLKDLTVLTKLFSHRNLVKGYITTQETDEPYHCKSFKCTIKNGMRTIRTIQKVIKATKYPHLDLFEKWCNKVNFINTNAQLNTKLTLSINPIDFISMSDNTCNWTSCMSWRNDGCYHAGTLEMMNSNVAIVAYLEGPQTFSIYDAEGEQFIIPNKSWRSLFYVHKKIILAGKAYPYYNKEVSIIVLDWLRELVKDNLNWKYQFINQLYKDERHLENNFYLRDDFDVMHDRTKKHHNIFVYTNGMYNDIIEAHEDYLCCRNYVNHSIKLCLSGPATCVCCGKVISSREEIYDYSDLGKSVVCRDCRSKKTCVVCGKVHYHTLYKSQSLRSVCSTACAQEVKYYPKLNLEITNSSDHYRDNIIIISKEKELEEEIWEDVSVLAKDPMYTSLATINYFRKKYRDRIQVHRIGQLLVERNNNFYKFPYRYLHHMTIRFCEEERAGDIIEWIQKSKDVITLAEYIKIKEGRALCN